MHPLNGSVTREEAIRLLHLTPAVLDAVLESGGVLCQLRNGEPHIPLQQLESYFRDRLLSVYRAESELARGEATAASAAEATGAASEEQRASTEGTANAAEERAGSAEERRSAAEGLSTSAEETPAAAEERRPAVEATASSERGNDGDGANAAGDDAGGELTLESRLAPRYVPRRQIDGIFADTRFTIVQISATGLRIRHDDAILPGTEAKVSFALLNPARSVMLRARVVWTSVAQESGSERTFWISGLRVTQHPERLAQAIESLRSTHELQPDRRAVPRPAAQTLAATTGNGSTPEGVSDEEIALVVRATDRFASDPLEASRWYGRGRFALADEQVRRVAPRKPREREEVLAVWEFLDRRIEVEKVTAILSWAKKARPRFVGSSTSAST